MGRTVVWSPWRFVAWFGVASMLADMVYEGARSLTGPYLASLGVSAAVVGAITGGGEAIGLAGRLFSGPLVDRTRNYWGLALGGYALTVLSVPLLGLTSVVWIVAGLVFAERAGKALRRPAKDLMLSHATSAIGRGKGFAVHEALDQIGAVVGPLVVAAVFAVTGRYAPSFAILAIPGVGVILLLVWLSRRVPDPTVYEPGAGVGMPPAKGAGRGKASRVRAPRERASRERLGKPFWWYLAFATTTTIGYSTFGVLSFHLVTQDMVAPAGVPVLYAVAMGVDALAALAAGAAFDRWGKRVLVVIPFLAAAVPPLAFSSNLGPAVAGILVWAVVMGIQESVMRAAIADLVPAPRRGTAFGVFAAALGGAALVGGVATGALYETSLPLLVGGVAAVQVVALVLYTVWSRRGHDGTVTP